jgi:hypothetical protein
MFRALGLLSDSKVRTEAPTIRFRTPRTPTTSPSGPHHLRTMHHRPMRWGGGTIVRGAPILRFFGHSALVRFTRRTVPVILSSIKFRSLNVPLSFHGRATLSTLPRTVNSRISVPMPTPRRAPYNPPRGSPIRNPHSNSPGRFRASCSQWSDLTATIFAPPSPRLHSRCRGGQLPRPLCTHVVPLLLRAHTASASGSPSPHAAGRHLAAQTGGLLLR